jgi:hypothetical protein
MKHLRTVCSVAFLNGVCLYLLVVGLFHLNYGLLWNKGQCLGQGQCPVMMHNVHLMKTILHDRVDLSKLLNVQVEYKHFELAEVDTSTMKVY